MVLSACEDVGAGSTLATLTIADAPALKAVPRIGVNLNAHTTWGSEQLLRNMLGNPGLEPALDRAVVIVAHAGGSKVQDNHDWLARPAGFWTGGRWWGLSGALAGREGTIAGSGTAATGLPEFDFGQPVSAAVGDAIAVERRPQSELPAQWSVTGSGEADAPRPGSTGAQSLRLTAQGVSAARASAWADGLAKRAGRMLPVAGTWRLKLWIKGNTPDARAKLRFQRIGGTPFIDRTLSPGSEWQALSIDFDGIDDSAPQSLEFYVHVEAGSVSIDDAYLGPAAGDGAFRPEVVKALTTLQPGLLRDWQGQLGDAVDNRLADAYAQRPTRYRPPPAAPESGYSIPDFLDLCREVGATPWVNLPVTLRGDELQRLGTALSARATSHGLKEVFVEFGNENWNGIFRPGSISGPKALGEAAQRAFTALRAATSGLQLHLVLGVQHVNPNAALELAARVPAADRLGVGPYLAYSVSAAEANRLMETAFADDGGHVRKLAEKLPATQRVSVYEVNFHSTQGDAALAAVQPLVSGAVSGPALAKRLIEDLNSGVREQLIWNLAQFDTGNSRNELLRLFGVVRELNEPQRFRPSGHALALLNRVWQGDAHAVACAGRDCAALTLAAFHDGERVGLVAVNASERSIPIELPAMHWENASVLDGSQPERNNETSNQVFPQNMPLQSGPQRLSISPYSLLVVSGQRVKG